MEEGLIMYPEVIVGALILNNDGKILLLKSHKWEHTYAVPGGHMEFCEKTEDAIKREVKEETNLDVHDIEFISFKEAIFDDWSHKKRHFIFLDFSCKTNGGEIILNDEAYEYVWVELEKVSELPLYSHTKDFIEKFKKRRQSCL